MKRNIFLIIVLILLFVFGVLIYDFSDEMGEEYTKHKWYLSDNNIVYVLSLKDNKFSYLTEDGKEVSGYEKCERYQFNNNVNLLKMTCDGVKRRINVTSEDDKLILNENGEDFIFYASKEIALVENFKLENNLSDSDYNKLLSLNFEDSLFINYKKFNELYKAKKNFYVALVSDNINYQNVYKYQVLNNLITNSTKNIYLISIDKLSESDLKKLTKLTKVTNHDEKLYVFEVKNKKVYIKESIEATNVNDVGNYKNI